MHFLQRTFTTALFIAAAQNAIANEDEAALERMKAFARDNFQEWVISDIVIEAIRKQNRQTSALEPRDIAELDSQWQAQTTEGVHPMMDEIMSRPVSQFLGEQLVAQQGRITEVIIMDAQGLNVAQTAPTSDYWQGDEEKYTQTYLAGPDGYHISGIEQGENPQVYQNQVSMSLVDPETGDVIGAVTLSLNAVSFY